MRQARYWACCSGDDRGDYQIVEVAPYRFARAWLTRVRLNAAKNVGAIIERSENGFTVQLDRDPTIHVKFWIEVVA